MRFPVLLVVTMAYGCSAADRPALARSSSASDQDLETPGRKSGAAVLRVDLSARSLREASSSNTLQLALSDGTVINAHSIVKEAGATIYSGLVTGGGQFRITESALRLEGAFDTSDKAFRLRTNQSGETVLYEIDRDEAEAVDVRPYVLPTPWPPVKHNECNDGLTIAVGFTKRLGKSSAADRVAKLDDLQKQLTTLLSEADPALSVTLVDAGEVDDPSKPASRDAPKLVKRLADDSDGLWDALHNNPEDLVFVLDNTDNRGAASSVGSTPDSRFAVVNIEHALTTRTFSHEFGHLAGAGHELHGSQSAAPGFTSGYGWVDSTSSQMTVMSTNKGYSRTLHFSHPTTWGNDDGDPATDSAYVASVLRTTVPYLASLSCR